MKSPLITILLIISIIFGASPITVDASSRTVYVDYDRGSDSNSGLSQSQPFQHAPGDPSAGGNAKAWKYQAGDTVLFKGGVRYRGQIKARFLPGTEAAPIVLKGDGWGGRAIFDGSENLRATKCTSQVDCLGAPNWTNLWKASVARGSVWTHQVFDTETNMPLMVAQFPAANTLLDTDEISLFMKIPKADTASLKLGLIKKSVDVSLQLGTPALGIWGQPNVVKYTEIIKLDGEGIHFDSKGYTPYTDRDNRFTILNSVGAVTKPSTFAIDSSKGIVIIYPPDGGSSNHSNRFSLGSGRLAFQFTDASHVIVEGFDMFNYASRKGITANILRLTQKVDNITFRNNFAQGFTGLGSDNMLQVGSSPYTRIVNNNFRYVLRARVITSGSSRQTGPVEIGCNIIQYAGRTAIGIINGHSTTIRNNLVEHSVGVHGNGITIYLDNRDMVVEGNVSRFSDRPFTMHGDKNDPVFSGGQPSIILKNNFFGGVAGDTGPNSAIRSWGANLKNVVIEGNKTWSEYAPLALNKSDQNITIKNNVLAGKRWSANPSIDSTNTVIIDANSAQARAIKAQIESATPNYSGCTVPPWAGGNPTPTPNPTPNPTPTPNPSPNPTPTPNPSPNPTPTPDEPSVNTGWITFTLKTTAGVYREPNIGFIGVQPTNATGKFDLSRSGIQAGGVSWASVVFDSGRRGFINESLVIRGVPTVAPLAPIVTNNPTPVKTPVVNNKPIEAPTKGWVAYVLRASAGVYREPNIGFIGVQPTNGAGRVDRSVKPLRESGITWVKAYFDSGRTGYVNESLLIYLQATNPPLIPEASNNPTQVTPNNSGLKQSSSIITTENLNLRSSPNGPVLRVQPKNSIGTISPEIPVTTASGQQWVYVKFNNGIAGYVAQNYTQPALQTNNQAKIQALLEQIKILQALLMEKQRDSR